MNAKKVKILLASVVIGAVTTAGPFFSSGFSTSVIAEWLMNALFVIAVIGFLGMKFLGGDDRPEH